MMEGESRRCKLLLSSMNGTLHPFSTRRPRHVFFDISALPGELRVPVHGMESMHYGEYLFSEMDVVDLALT